MMNARADKTKLQFLGVGSCVPPPGGETACFSVNGTVLVDCGWNAALQMRRFGRDPMALTHVFLTHCHHDHYLGLAPLVYYRAMVGRTEGGPERLVVVGPRLEVAEVVKRALHYLQTDRYDDLPVPVQPVPLRPGEQFETERLLVRSAQVLHPTLSLAYRFEDKVTGASFVITGDTACYAPLGRFAEDVDVLVHEASMGPGSVDPLQPWGHSGALDAARVASEARAKRLCLVHCPQDRRGEILRAARGVFPETHMPCEGDVLEMPL